MFKVNILSWRHEQACQLGHNFSDIVLHLLKIKDTQNKMLNNLICFLIVVDDKLIKALETALKTDDSPAR